MPTLLHDPLEIPPARRAALEAVAAALATGRSVALSTHINSDGDGCGSEAALALMLAERGVKARIVNPTPWPNLLGFLLEGVSDQSAKGAKALDGCDQLVVLDISDVKRLGALTDAVRAFKGTKLVIDHHQPAAEPPGSVIVADTTACATGEIVFDLARVMDLHITPAIARALYTAILTDTGGFRYSNTTPRCHAVAAQLLAAGVDPEEMYRRIYAQVSVGRLQLLRDALASLEVDAACGLAWISLPAGVLEKYDVRAEDLDGLSEHPRSVAGTRMALFFRDLGHGQVKVSFRSTGGVDVHRFAKEFGGGGHSRASGAMIPGKLDEVQRRVVDAARAYVRAGGGEG